jgi:hypothetical protein
MPELGVRLNNRTRLLGHRMAIQRSGGLGLIHGICVGSRRPRLCSSGISHLAPSKRLEGPGTSGGSGSTSVFQRGLHLRRKAEQVAAWNAEERPCRVRAVIGRRP